MPNARLDAILSELEQELSTLRNVDEQQRAALQESVTALRSALTESDRSASQRRSLADDVSEAVASFEGHHPNLTAIIGRLADGLSQMGI
jgi:phenylpyruvate tautomerase PptA (4-oxalocrotonate tautomerase family)